MLNIALPKGRLGNQVYALFGQLGYDTSTDFNNSRKLIIKSVSNDIQFLLVKPADVAIYVERGAADVGIVGKDILEETQPQVYELLDLNLGKCSMCVAAPSGYIDSPVQSLRVATKFPRIAKEHYNAQGRDIDVIKLNGSIELAPILGLSDVIVDIVESGKTLRQNHLKVVETFMSISARLIANKSSFKFKEQAIQYITQKLSEVIANDTNL